MTIEVNGASEENTKVGANGAPPLSKSAQLIPSSLPDLDPSKLEIQLRSESELKVLPDLNADGLIFGATTTDHMLVATFDPSTGWSTPTIKPYGPLALDPASHVLQYSSTVFEGMKAYLSPEGKPRLFRPQLNMKRMRRSVERAALPTFNEDALLVLIKRLVEVDQRWVPKRRNYSLYIRPTVIGTRSALGVAASTHAMLYVILTPSGPYFPSGIKPVSILASVDCQTASTSLNPDGDPPARSWPGGTGEYKLGINYAPTFDPQRAAAKKGYDQVLWVIDDKSKDGAIQHRITECGQMNLFFVFSREDGDIDLVTPRLDGTILPGVTRSSILALGNSHSSSSPIHPSLPVPIKKVHALERTMHMSEVGESYSSGKLMEVFGCSTAAVVVPIGRIGYQGQVWTLPVHEGGLGPIARAFFEKITDIQEGKEGAFGGWSVPCTS